jgi:hypothetical protein
LRAPQQVTGRAQSQKVRAVKGEHERERDTAENGVGREQVPEVSDVVAVRIQRDAMEQARQSDSPDERNAGAAAGVGPEPDAPPDCAVALVTPLERDDADDQEKEDEQQREIKP